MFGLDRLDEAEQALKQALFLNADCIEALYQLGLVLLRRGEKAQGLKKFHLILQKLKTADAKRVIHNMPGVTFGQFADILRSEIQFYEKHG